MTIALARCAVRRVAGFGMALAVPVQAQTILVKPYIQPGYSGRTKGDEELLLKIKMKGSRHVQFILLWPSSNALRRQGITWHVVIRREKKRSSEYEIQKKARSRKRKAPKAAGFGGLVLSFELSIFTFEHFSEFWLRASGVPAPGSLSHKSGNPRRGSAPSRTNSFRASKAWVGRRHPTVTTPRCDSRMRRSWTRRTGARGRTTQSRIHKIQIHESMTNFE